MGIIRIVYLSHLPPCPRSGGAAVSGTAWYLWRLLFSPCGDQGRLWEKAVSTSMWLISRLYNWKQLILVLRLLFSTRSVQSSRFGLVGVPSWVAWLHWIIQLSYDALRPCHSGPRRTCWLGTLRGVSCPSVSALINGKHNLPL